MFWRSHMAMRTKFDFSTTFHPQKDKQLGRSIQILEDTLWACVLGFSNNQDKHLLLVEFAYNSSYQGSIGMAPYKALYRHQCQSPINWDEARETKMLGLEIVQQISEVIKKIKEKFRIA